MKTTRYNNYRIVGEIAYIQCHDGVEILIDSADVCKVSDYVCFYREGKGAFLRIARKTFSLPRFLLGNPKFRVQHLDRNPKNCCRNNLFAGNSFERFGTYWKVYCYDGRYFLIDSDDYDKVHMYVWHIDLNGYVVAKINNKTTKLHRYLLSPAPDMEVDHIDRNPLNNRKSNLRFANRSINCFNRSTPHTNTSGHKGVYRSKDGQWHGQITYNGTKYYLGTFTSADEAITARLKAEEILLNAKELQTSSQDPNRVRFNDQSKDVESGWLSKQCPPYR